MSASRSSSYKRERDREYTSHQEPSGATGAYIVVFVLVLVLFLVSDAGRSLCFRLGLLQSPSGEQILHVRRLRLALLLHLVLALFGFDQAEKRVVNVLFNGGSNQSCSPANSSS